jgi:hypothetical protein
VRPGHYAKFRQQARPSILREGAKSAPPERLLQTIWQQQRIHRDALQTANGRSVRVLHPGFLNREAGPDFHHAVVQFDGQPPRVGDIEVDLQPSGWRAHGHDTNQNFQNVVLHVVWDAGAAKLAATPPTLALKPVLDSSLVELEQALGTHDGGKLPAEFTGRCNAPLKSLDDAALGQLLNEAALVRFENKAAAFAARARAAGWEQALWEGLFTALGYKHNVWPMRRVAELLPALRDANPKDRSALNWQARLLGIAGLLPAEITRRHRSVDERLVQLWEIWWRERDAWETQLVPRATWKFAGLRPANQPHRRLALAAHWVADGKLIPHLEGWLRAGESPAGAPRKFITALQPADDAFWSRHTNFSAAPLPHPQALLGDSRATELAINAVLPWLHARAAAGRNAVLRERIEEVYFAWSAGEDNAVLKLARRRLLGGTSAARFKTAAWQQGLIQIVRDFCDHSNATCEGCQFPGLVRQFGTAH